MGKSVTRVDLVKFLHYVVSGDLGHDGSTGDGETKLVASGYSSLGNRALKQGYPIDQEECRLREQVFYRLHHSQLGCLEDIHGVNYLRGNDANTHGHA